MRLRRKRPLDVSELAEFGKVVTMGPAEYRVVSVSRDHITETITVQLVSQIAFDHHYRIPGGTQ